MPWEFEPDEGEDLKDKTYIWWIIIGLTIVASIGYFVVSSDRESDISRVRVRHIMIAYDNARPNTRDNAMERIVALRDRALNGESFARLAREHSHDANSKDRGGDLGWRRKGDLYDSLDAFAWSAPVGEVSEVLDSPEAFHIAVIVDRELGIHDRYELKLREQGGN